MHDCHRFLSSESGSFAPAFAVVLVPVLLAMGLAVDYTSATSDRAKMQNALDSAVLSITTMKRTATDAERQTVLQNVYAANGGQGTATLLSVSFDVDGTMHASTSASYAMPTDFMSLAKIQTVNIGVSTSVRKNPSLIEATFKIDKASGYWDKTITLFGADPAKTDADPMMKIDYKYNGAGGAKGYGTTTVYTKDAKGNFTVIQQQQVCTTQDYKKSIKLGTFPTGPFKDGDSKLTSCSMPVAGDGAAIDVSKVNDLYLQMEVTTGNKDTFRSNDPAKSNRLFIDGVQVPKNQIVNIFTAVPCGETSSQAWEDGGTAEANMTLGDADFFYKVSGKCDFNQRPSVTSLVQ